MKLKAVFLMLALIAAASPANAGPKNWLKHHKRISERIVAATVGTIVEEKAVTACSIGNVEKCIEGYGSRRTFANILAVASFTFVGVSYACDKNQPNWWFCDVLGNGFPALQIGLGIHDFTVNNPCVYDQPCGGRPVAWPDAVAHERFKLTQLKH